MTTRFVSRGARGYRLVLVESTVACMVGRTIVKTAVLRIGQVKVLLRGLLLGIRDRYQSPPLQANGTLSSIARLQRVVVLKDVALCW